VAEHGAGRSPSELLDVGAAEPAREHVERLFRLGEIRELRSSVRV
jgi:hypothetical protein